MPNFLIAGGIATGTSFLSATLAHHPDVYLPRIQRPEPNFFHYSWKFSRGIEWYLETWFHEVGSEKAIGERSSLLLTSDSSPKRIMNTLGKIQLIFCLRNPIERAWGNYRFSVLEGLEPLSFDDAISKEAERISSAEGIWSEVQPHAYVARSRYASFLREYLETFGSDRVLLIKSEDLGRNPRETLRKVLDFLDVDSSIELPLPPNYSSPSVVSRAVQVELREYFGDRFPEIVESIRQENVFADKNSSVEDRARFAQLQENLRAVKEPLPSQLRHRLRDLFESEVAEISSLVDFSVEDWV